MQLNLDSTKFSQRNIKSFLDRGLFYEPEVSWFLIKNLEQGDIFIDIGAHVGFFTILAGEKVGESGHVYSFEPEEENYKQLIEQIKLNRFGNITPFNFAVGEKQNVRDFYINSDNDGGHCFWDVSRHPFNRKCADLDKQITKKVKIAPLDGILENYDLSALKAIKIDVEGFELAVLSGAKKILQQHKPYVIAEVNRFGLEQLGYSEQQMIQFMENLDYSTHIPYYDLFGQQLSLHPYSKPIVNDANDVFNILFMGK